MSTLQSQINYSLYFYADLVDLLRQFDYDFLPNNTFSETQQIIPTIFPQ